MGYFEKLSTNSAIQVLIYLLISFPLLFLLYRCLLGCCHFCSEPWNVTQPKELLHLNFSIIPSFAAHPILHLLRTWWKVFDTVFANLTTFLFGGLWCWERTSCVQSCPLDLIYKFHLSDKAEGFLKCEQSET